LNRLDQPSAVSAQPHPLPGRVVAAYSVLTLPTATALGLPITVYLPHSMQTRWAWDWPWSVSPMPQIPFEKAVTAILQRALVADISIAFAIGVAGSYIFLATWVFVLPEFACLVLLAFFVSGLVFMPSWMRLSYRLGNTAR